MLLAVVMTACPQQDASPSASSATPTASAFVTSSASPGAEPCYGLTELTEEQRYEFQVLIDDGKKPCPGWTEAMVRIEDGKGLSLNGKLIVPVAKLPTKGLGRVAPLFKRLKKFRRRWKSFQPNKPFKGTLRIEAGDKTKSLAAISALHEASLAGYVKTRIETSQVGVDFDALIPHAPGQEAPPLRVLYVEPLSGGEAIVGLLLQGPRLKDKKQVQLRSTKLSDWLKPHCATVPQKPCVDGVVFRASTDGLERTLARLRQLQQALGQSDSGSAKIHVVLRCGFYPTTDQFLAGPWGKREPPKPCF